MKSLQILVISQYWYPENGVPQRRWAWLAEILKEQGHSVTVVAPPAHYDRRMSFPRWVKARGFLPRKESETGPSGERIVRSGFFPGGTSLTVRAFNQAAVALGSLQVLLAAGGSIKGYRPDLIFGTVPALPTSAVTWLASKRFQAPYVIDLRDAWPDLLKESDSWNEGTGKKSFRQRVLSVGLFQIVSWLTQRVLYRSMREADAIISTSSELAEDLRQRALLMRNGSTPPVFTIRNVFPVATKFKTNSNVDTSRTLRVLYAGTIGRAQDLQNAVDALRLCIQQGVDVRLRFVGSGAAKLELQRISKDLGSAVSFEPRHPADSLEEYYQWADTALVHLADWEPLKRTVPSKVYELMETGIHISAVVQGEAASIITGLNAGTVVRPNDPKALAELWTQLVRNPKGLEVSDSGANWVKRQRSHETPCTLSQIISTVAKRNE